MRYFLLAILFFVISGCSKGPDSDTVFNIFKEWSKPFSRGDVYYELVGDGVECIKHVNEKKEDFDEEFEWWNCKLTEQHNTVYGYVEVDYVLKLRSVEDKWTLMGISELDMRDL